MRFLSTLRHPDLDGVRSAWRDFVADRDAAPRGVRPYVLRAWRRSRDAGCDPFLARAHVLSPAETDALLREQDRLASVAAPFLAALSRAAGDERHAAMLADGRGRLLRVVGDGATMADEDFPRPGSLLSESTSGANGVGTTVAEGGYVELVGPEHYIEGFHAFTCQGVPLLGPDAALAGVLSVSVRRQQTADRLRDILFCASEAAQCELLATWLSETTAGAADGAPVLERLRQDMVQRITLARLQLERAARTVAGGADATATIDAARELTRRFKRQSEIWRQLAVAEIGVPEPERIALADTVSDFMDLLQTEARVLAVGLAWGTVDRILVVEDPRLLSRALLGAFLTAMQTAPAGAELVVDVRADGARGVVRLRAPGAGNATLATVEAARER